MLSIAKELHLENKPSLLLKSFWATTMNHQTMILFQQLIVSALRGCSNSPLQRNIHRLCELYDKPKLYFVVHPHRFAAFKMQSFKAKTGSADVTEIHELKQFVLELPVI
jgi:hypothetical protein